MNLPSLLLTLFLTFNLVLSITAQTVELPRGGFLGAQVAPVSEEVRTRLKLPAGRGVQIVRADAQTSAEEAGLKAGDVILKLNDAEVNSPSEFIALVRPKKAGDKFQLTILRVDKEETKTITLKPRPFEASADFEILYRSVATQDGRRRVIITRPKAPGKYPAVLMVGGVGCYSLDNLPPDHAYARILYGLTRNNFVTMRVEKSGMGDSEGAPCQSPQVDMRREVEGYVAGLRALKTYDFVDASKTFIFGHSIGGNVGPAVATEEPVRGIIVAETIGTNWFEYALENVRRQSLLRDLPYDQTERQARLYGDCKYRLWVEKKTPEQVVKENSACTQYVSDPAPYTYMQQITEQNLAETWKKLGVPTLVIYGTSDFLTSAKEHTYLRDMINQFHPGKATYVEISGMDHWFERAASQRESMQQRASQQSAPPQFHEQVFTETLNWLTQQIKNASSASGNKNSTQISQHD